MNYSMIASGLALLVALVPGPGTIHANETGKKIAELANKVYEELKQLKVTEVGVEGFNDTGRSHSSAGPLIQSRLMDELKKLDVTINPKANVYITGEFLPDKRPEEGHLGVKLICILREKDGEVVKQFTTTLGYKSNEDVVKLLALSVDFTEYVKADSKERNEHLKKQQEEPPAYTQKDKIKVRKDSPFAVEILAAMNR